MLPAHVTANSVSPVHQGFYISGLAVNALCSSSQALLNGCNGNCLSSTRRVCRWRLVGGGNCGLDLDVLPAQKQGSTACKAYAAADQHSRSGLGRAKSSLRSEPVPGVTFQEAVQPPHAGLSGAAGVWWVPPSKWRVPTEWGGISRGGWVWPRAEGAECGGVCTGGRPGGQGASADGQPPAGGCV